VSEDAPGNVVFVYDIGADGSITGPSRTLSGPATTLDRPRAIAVDKLGTLYVVNYHRDITVYAPGAGGNTAPVTTFGAGTYPEFIGNNGSYGIGIGGAVPKTDGGQGFDQSRETINLVNIYNASAPPGFGIVSNLPFIVANSSSFASSPDSGAAGAGISELTCFGETPLYSGGSVTCYGAPLGTMTTNGNTYLTAAFSYALPEIPGGITFRADGLLAVASDGAYMTPAAIHTYALPGSVPQTYPTPMYSISGSNTGLLYPTGIAFDSLGNIYVDDYGMASGNGTVKQWPKNTNGNVAPARTVGGLNFNFSIAVGP
jgi:hypothetical protein